MSAGFVHDNIVGREAAAEANVLVSNSGLDNSLRRWKNYSSFDFFTNHYDCVKITQNIHGISVFQNYGEKLTQHKKYICVCRRDLRLAHYSLS